MKGVLIMKKTILTATIIGVATMGLVGCGGKSDNKTADASSEAKTEAVTQTKVVTEATTTTPAPTTAAVSVSKKNAIQKAKDYLKYSAFSKPGLIAQLEFEGFSTEDSEYAVENITVDWNQQAAKKAKEFLEYSSFSHSGLVEQLEIEGFTNEEAEFGTTSVGL
ncbi:MAG: Ltp family lipoprotein [Clostridiales bacterium]|nr:Ltp family lipoprotein [Clostridiales bacterium]MBS5877528.1 Ltp family lipoprotein [Clostridiales bacterium]